MQSILQEGLNQLVMHLFLDQIALDPQLNFVVGG